MFDYFPFGAKAAVVLYAFVFGAIIGSFLSVLTYRGERGQDFVRGRSRCPVCGHTLRWYDLFPLFSWIFLGGKCRYCKAKIPSRYPLLELSAGVFYAAAVTAAKNPWQLLVSFVLFAALIALSLCDIETMEIPYKYTITIGILGILSFAASFHNPLLLDSDGQSPVAHIIGLFIVSVPFAALVLIGGMGGGDVQLMAAAGLLLGWKIIPAAAIGIVAGAVFGAVWKFTRKPDATATPGISESAAEPATPGISRPWDKDNPDETDSEPEMKGAICFGPFLSFGIGISYLIGQNIIDFYLGMIK
jgi:leader peptidase (prepilin peptidase)/N-methyltransferase